VESAFLGQYNYPANIILSVDDVVVHGVPMDIPFESGSVVKVDYGIRYKGYLTDAATTIIIGEPKNARHVRCIQVAKDALAAGIAQAKAGNFVGDISAAIETTVTQ
jgi:methionyl aminopeptidase